MRVRKKIKISGIISCKSFISYVFNLAKRLDLSGWIKVGGESTNIEVEGDNASIIDFMSTIYDDPKKLARVAELDYYDMPVLNSDKFYIIENDSRFIYFESAPQDKATCDSCMQKFNDPSSRMYQYPFVACEECGPKYSTIDSLPYTRDNSSLDKFKFCEKCESDIEKGIIEANFSNCPICGPRLWLKAKDNLYFNQKEAFDKAEQILMKNGILLIKSTNCFYLCSNAKSIKAVEKIREIKSRKHKPLTVMAKDIEEIEKFAHINDVERDLLTSEQRPVVMLQIKDRNYLAQNVANGFDKIGVMLPFNPIHHLLFRNQKLKVLVMSSANTGGGAIETDNEKAELHFSDKVDGILLHDLDILNGSDDSLVTVVNNERYFLRLSRGYAPNDIVLKDIESYPVVLACGAEQSSTIALATPDGKVHVSSFIGNLETANVFDLYKRNVILFCKLFNVTPEYAVCDLNPDYLSTRYVMNLRIPYYKMQHHYAHLISCLVDNNLSVETPVIGVIFDGSGFGDDQTIWGGEFLVSRNLSYERLAHIPVFKMTGMKGKESQINRLGYSILQKAGINREHAIYKNLKISREEENSFSSMMNRGVSSPLTSAAGKLFDAVASILGIITQTSYEEYSVLYLEALADKSVRDAYNLKDFNIKNTNELIQYIVGDTEQKVSIPVILAKFHNTLAKMVAVTCLEISNKTRITQVVLSGSVWMNTFLLTRVMEELEKVELMPLIHKNISTNDEGLSLGQASYLVYKIAHEKILKSGQKFIDQKTLLK